MRRGFNGRRMVMRPRVYFAAPLIRIKAVLRVHPMIASPR
jgi:hypothetical protein